MRGGRSWIQRRRARSPKNSSLIASQACSRPNKEAEALADQVEVGVVQVVQVVALEVLVADEDLVQDALLGQGFSRHWMTLRMVH